jgi:hypothetical protein
VAMTTAQTSQKITPVARTHGVPPDDRTMIPTTIVAMARRPTRRAHTAIFQCPLRCNSIGSSIQRMVEGTQAAGKGPWSSMKQVAATPGERSSGKVARHSRFLSRNLVSHPR